MDKYIQIHCTIYVQVVQFLSCSLYGVSSSCRVCCHSHSFSLVKCVSLFNLHQQFYNFISVHIWTRFNFFLILIVYCSVFLVLLFIIMISVKRVFKAKDIFIYDFVISCFFLSFFFWIIIGSISKVVKNRRNAIILSTLYGWPNKFFFQFSYFFCKSVRLLFYVDEHPFFVLILCRRRWQYSKLHCGELFLYVIVL